jgi:hypothetical protein
MFSGGTRPTFENAQRKLSQVEKDTLPKQKCMSELQKQIGRLESRTELLQ